jgi:hypothetical protein
MIIVLYINPVIGFQVNGPMTAQCHLIVAGDELKIAACRMMLR